MTMGKSGNRGFRDNLYQRGDKWYVRFWHGNREIRRLGGATKQAAQIVLAELRKAAERGELPPPRKGQSGSNTKITLADWAPEYLGWAEQHKKSFRRDQWCLAQLIERFGTFRLRDIKKDRVEAFMRDRRDEVAPATVNRQVALLRKVLSYAVEHGGLDENPLRGIKLFREAADRNPVLSQEEERRLTERLSPWMQWVVRLAVCTGCRQGELRNLRWRHVDFEGCALVIETSKSGESRRVPVHPSLLPELQERRGTPEGYVVSLPNGEVPAQVTISKAFKAAAKAIERGELRFHDLRHVAASRFLETGASLPEVADLLGHKTLVMAKRYAHTNPNRMRELMGKMAVMTSPAAKS